MKLLTITQATNFTNLTTLENDRKTTFLLFQRG